MLKYFIFEETKDKIIYKYFPEGNETSGIISIEKATGKIDIISLAENDRHKIYAWKLILKLETFYKTQAYKEEGIIAWY